MERLFEKLEALITRETSVYGELLELSLKEKDAIISNDVPGIDAAANEKKKLMEGLKQLESERKGLFCDYSKITFEQSPTYRKIMDAAKGAVRNKLLGLSERLEETAAELKRVNALNRALLDTQMKYTSFFINLITGAADTAGTYSNSGRLRDTNANYSLLDQTI